MPEVPQAGARHGPPLHIGGGEHVLVAHRTAGLDHGRSAGFRRREQPVGKGEEGVGGDHAPLRRRLATARFARGIGSLGSGDPGRIDPAHLAGADPDRRKVLRIDDGIRLDVLGDAEGEF
jgi:hypothetical protein